MTPEEIAAGEARLTELNAENETLRKEVRVLDQQVVAAEKALARLRDTRIAAVARRDAVKEEYGKLYEDVGIAKKEAARRDALIAAREAMPAFEAQARGVHAATLAAIERAFEESAAAGVPAEDAAQAREAAIAAADKNLAASLAASPQAIAEKALAAIQAVKAARKQE